MVLLQLLVVGSVIGGLITWLLRSLMCKAKNEVINKAILVTGCDSGIGHELAKHLDSLGFYVFAACLDTSSEGAQRLRIEASPMLRLVNMDVTNEDHVRHALDYVAENLSAGQQGLYGLVNNAGICVCGEFEWLTWKQIQHQVEVNLLGTMRVTKYCMPLIKATQGRIINVSSVAGLYGYPGLSVYSATKHALEGYSAALRQECAKFNVKVVTVQPGDFSKATHLLDSHHRNMNEMWSEMTDLAREEYKDYFIRYHNSVAKTGITGKRIKPATVLPQSVVSGFEKAILTKVPDESYLLLPNLRQHIKMSILSWLPGMVSQFWIARQYQKAWSSRSTDFKSSSSVVSSRPSSCNSSTCTTPTPFIGLPPSSSRPSSTRPSSSLYASKLSPSTSIRSYSSRSTVSTSGSTMSSMRF